MQILLGKEMQGRLKDFTLAAQYLCKTGFKMMMLCQNNALTC